MLSTGFGQPHTPEQIEEAARTGELPAPPPHVEREDVFTAHYLYIVYRRTRDGMADVRPSLGELQMSGLTRITCRRYRKHLEETMGRPTPVNVDAVLPYPLPYRSAEDVFREHYIYHNNRRTSGRMFVTRPTVEELAETSNIPERTCEEYRERLEAEMETLKAA
ncbi:MAG: hypothetical protein ABIY70_08685 [Capsulimonas sp.]|uniref:hypothetical protein n=1 Tax=Capsulimonas sp. TaxID=2494211 RepID=UPI003265EA9A